MSMKHGGFTCWRSAGHAVLEGEMRRLLALLPLLVLISCATVRSGRDENIEVNSTPPGADALLTCAHGTPARGVTPVVLRIRRNSGACELRLSKEGFEEQRTALASGINGTFWGNFGFIPLLPAGYLGVAIGSDDDKPGDVAAGTAMILTSIAVFVVDYKTGAMHEHDPNRIDAVLTPRP